MFDIYYDALSKDPPEFGEIPRRFQLVINDTLKNDLLIQAGLANQLPRLNEIQKSSVIAFQKAQNKVSSDVRRRSESDAKQE